MRSPSIAAHMTTLVVGGASLNGGRGTALGALLGTLNELVRCDCTTRNARKAKQLADRHHLPYVDLSTGVQKLADGEALGGITKAEDDFEPIEDDG